MKQIKNAKNIILNRFLKQATRVGFPGNQTRRVFPAPSLRCCPAASCRQRTVTSRRAQAFRENRQCNIKAGGFLLRPPKKIHPFHIDASASPICPQRGCIKITTKRLRQSNQNTLRAIIKHLKNQTNINQNCEIISFRSKTFKIIHQIKKISLYL